MLEAISVGHAGILVRVNGLTIACDPWFTPAFFGSWFVFPRNDQLDPALMDEICNADYLYVSHLHGDHFDADFLTHKMSKDTTVLLPGFPTRELEREFNKLGFKKFVRTVDSQEHELRDGVSIAIHVETSITDGPAGDSAIVITNGTQRLVNQNDCRTTDTNALASHGPVDLHWLQFSGAIWYPMVYEMDATTKKQLCVDKVESQFSRAFRYIEALDAKAVVPSAGPPCFLDDDLFGNNMITGEELSIFPDQTEFLKRLSAQGRTNGIMNVPGTRIVLADDGTQSVHHPMSDTEINYIFTNKESYLRNYQADYAQWVADHKASWATGDTDLLGALQTWWQPLLSLCSSVREGIGANCLLNAGNLGILINFPEGRVEPFTNQPYEFRFDIDRSLVERVVANKAIDWSNSLFLSCRFTAWRSGEYNEFLYNFFKSLSVERMVRTEAEADKKLHGVQEQEADIVIGDYIVQRRCPHRNADLSVFGEIEGDTLVCTLHGWKFDCKTGKCLTAEEKQLRIKPRN